MALCSGLVFFLSVENHSLIFLVLFSVLLKIMMQAAISLLFNISIDSLAQFW